MDGHQGRGQGFAERNYPQNYIQFLQVSALAAGSRCTGHRTQALFDFQGAISTAGEHILNPDCSVRGVGAAELFSRNKSLRFDSASVSVGDFGIWRLYSAASGISWRRATVKHTPKDKMVVTLCVLLYFLAHKSEADVSPVFVPDYRNGGGRAGLAVFDGRVSECFFPFSYLRAPHPICFPFCSTSFEEPCFVDRHLFALRGRHTNYALRHWAPVDRVHISVEASW